MRTLARPHLLLLLSLATAGACGGGGGGSAADAAVDADLTPDAATIAPVLFTPRDDLSDDDLASQALSIMTGSGQNTCTECHGITKQRLFNWRAISDTSLSECLTDLTVPNQTVAQEMIDCLRKDPSDSNSPFSAQATAIYSAGAHLDWFEFTFRRAYGEDNYLEQFNTFKERVGMPMGAMAPLSQTEFDVLASWFSRGLPLIEAKLPEDPPPTECTPGVSAEVSAHVTETKLSGWRAVNKQNAMLMHGCDSVDGDPLECLTTYPGFADATFSEGWAASIPGQQIRILRENGYESSFWTRSSADGRYVGNGAQSGGAGVRIVDLKRDFAIPGNALYDPAFLPDNSGFMFQPGSFFCNQSMLAEAESIEFGSSPDCTSTGNVGLYQHVGANVNNGDYWAVYGQFVSDNGHGRIFSDPEASFGGSSRLKLVPIVHDGTTYQAGQTARIPIPYEGDSIISASSKMVLSRLRGPGNNQLGFVMRKVTATETKSGYDVGLSEVARYCFNGGKPAFSYDDRWLVLHHYLGDADAVDLGFTGSSDPEFADYQNRGSANIYLIDTLTGDVTRVTTMRAGEYALFPHFRSDGWIYFMVRNIDGSAERIVASDAALRLEAAEAQ